MAQAKEGDTVKVHYTGRLDDGTVFDTSADRDPLEFTVGTGRVIPGFEEGIVGMNTGESKTVTIPADKAYGPHHKEMQVEIARENLPEGLDPEVGDQLQVRGPDGNPVLVMVTDTNESTITLDANHPLAGKDLIFDIELVEID